MIPRIPQCYCYARVSTDRQADRSESIPGQVERCQAYYTAHLAPKGVGWQGHEADLFGVSGFKRKFESRPAGVRIMSKLERGDHLVFDKVDRVARKTSDLLWTLDWMEMHGITVHIVGLCMDTSTHIGKMVISMLGAFAQFEAGMNSQRQIERNAWARKNGKLVAGGTPMGTKNTVQKGQKMRVWDKRERTVMAEIFRLREDKHMSFEEVSQEIEKQLAYANNRPFSPSAFFKRTWSHNKCRTGYCIELYIRDHNIIDPRDIPPNPKDTAVRYARSIGKIR